MIHSQNVGVEVMALGSFATNATAMGIIDTAGNKQAAINFSLDTQAATTSKPSVLKLQQADDTNPTSFVDIPEFVGDGPSGFEIPAASPTVKQLIRFNVTMLGKKRYLRAMATPSGAAQLICINGELSRAGDTTLTRARNTVVVDG